MNIKLTYIVGLFFIVCGKPFHWYLWVGTELFTGTVKAKRSLSSGCGAIEKKQSFISIIMVACPAGTAVGERRPGGPDPIFYIVAFIVLKSCRKLHFPWVLFSITNVGIFQGLLEGSKYPLPSSFIKPCKWDNLLLEIGQWSTQTGSLDNHWSFMGSISGEQWPLGLRVL